MWIVYTLWKSLSKNVWNITATTTIFNKSFLAGSLRGRDTKWWLNYPFIAKCDLSESGLRHSEEMGLEHLYLCCDHSFCSQKSQCPKFLLYRQDFTGQRQKMASDSMRGLGYRVVIAIHPLKSSCWRCRAVPGLKPKWDPPAWHRYRAHKPGVAWLNQE